MNLREELNQLAAEKILILDGAMGSLIQAEHLSERDFRGKRFADHGKPLLGCSEVLCLTRPDLISGIHEAYLEAGADIIETCSLNATSICLDYYGLKNFAREISAASAAIAKKAADKFSDSNKRRFVAGSIGPTEKSATFTPDMDRPLDRQITWDELAASYYDNALGLIEGGADILLIETAYDSLNIKAALFAILRLGRDLGRDIPVMVSATVTENGRLLTGQTPEAFCVSMIHANPWALGLNCSHGAEKLKAPLSHLAALAPCPVCFYPNAGLPDFRGNYSDTPETMAASVESCIKEGLVNIVGGCCGSTPAHIAAIAQMAGNYRPREISRSGNKRFFAGTEILELENETCLSEIKNKIREPWQNAMDSGDYEEAMEIARRYISKEHKIGSNESGFLEISSDRAPDPVNTLRGFLFLAASYPDLAAFPVLVESDNWDIIKEGLKCFQGRGLVRYTGTLHGKDELQNKSGEILSYGAVLIIHY